MLRLPDCQNRLAEPGFDFHEMAGGPAPRVRFTSAPLKIAAATEQAHHLCGKPDNLIGKYPDWTHDFPEGIRQRAYPLFDRDLRR